MSLNYLCFGSIWRNLTSPMIHWHRGTAVQIDTMKDHLEMQVVIGQLGTDMVVLTMLARITQSIFTLARKLLQRRPLGWKIIPEDWKSKAFQAVLWMCWNVIDVLLAVEVTNVLIYKNMSKHSTHTGQSMNTISIKCHWGCKAELNKQNMVPEKELPSPRMDILQGNTCMEKDCDQKVFSDMDIMVSKETLLPSCTNPFMLSMICVPSEDGESLPPSEQSDLGEGEFDDCVLPCEELSLSESECEDEEIEKDLKEDCDHKVFSDMDIMVSKETLLPSCTNPLILSMICVPSEDGESLSLSEQSDLGEAESDGEFDVDCVLPCEELSESECENEEIEKDSSVEDTSVDSGMQESWTLKSKEDMNESEEESDWSDEETDSWDEASDTDCSRDDDLWASFCRNDDPYNPLSFAKPTRNPKISSIAEHGGSQTLKCTMKPQVKKPVLSSSKFSYKCASLKKKSESFEDVKQTGNPGVKKVHFSSNVSVHHMITWNYAYRMARKGPWEECARDRSRFQKRISETEAAIGFCLQPDHREKILAARHYKED